MSYPTVLHFCPVTTKLLSLRIREGEALAGTHVPYEPMPGDEMVKTDYLQSWVKRDGAFIGCLNGRNLDVLYTNEQAAGEALDPTLLDAPATYRIRADGTETIPVAVRRKSKPCDLARHAPFKFVTRYDHTVYLELPAPLAAGVTCTLVCALPGIPEQTLVYDVHTVFSEAVHVSHLGFRPDDPVKCAFLSCWNGAGGVDFGFARAFHLIDETGHAVFTGPVIPHLRAGEPEDDLGRNYTQADVYRMDFTGFTAPGRYRVAVDGVGCSRPFAIAAAAWVQPFVTAARAFYHQRSGMALTRPYTEFERPRGCHPDDGITIYESTATLMDTGNGLNRADDNFGNLVRGKTDRTVAGIWGAYFDAGDWDRRIQHLVATRYLLELADLFPERFRSLDLNIPESGTELPDVVHEALYNLDGYCRMQTPGGGVRGGVECEEHPVHGECSWNDSLTVLAYTPDVWSTYEFAGVAARAARVVRAYDASRADNYRERALRAMTWAESEYARGAGSAYQETVDRSRCLAAAELYRLTGDPAWCAVLEAMAPTALSLEAAWVCLQTDASSLPSALRENCRALLLREADTLSAAGARTGFNWAKAPDRHARNGEFSAPLNGVVLCRAHCLTGDNRYLRAAVLACQHGAGANPANLCYTTGLGHESPLHPLHIDSRITGRRPPAGITVFGPVDIRDNPSLWSAWAHELIKPLCHPASDHWPVCESYWDVFWNPPVCEFTIQNPLSQVAYVWGYLMARK